MTDGKKESRGNVNNLPQAEQVLTNEEANEVKGGYQCSRRAGFLVPLVVTNLAGIYTYDANGA